MKGQNGQVIDLPSHLFKATIDLNQAAGDYDLFTAVGEDIFVKNLSIRTPTGAIGGAVTYISIQTDDATPTVFINSTDGDVSKLTSEVCLTWRSFGEGIILKTGKKIQLTIGGGPAGVSKICDVIAEYMAINPKGYLA